LQASLRADEVETINRPTRQRMTEFGQMILKFQQKTQQKVAPVMEEVFTESGLEAALATDARCR
jgi:hypothetical protein